MMARGAAPLLAGLLGGCALLSRGTTLQPHYYDPEQAPHVAAGRVVPTCALRLGDVTASDDLGQSIAFRRSPHEVGYYETRRWNESPDNYLRRALVRALFDEQRCTQVLSGDAPTLEARLLAFEEQRSSPHRARVAVHVVLHDEHRVILETTLEAARPFGTAGHEPSFDEFVAAVSLALDDVVSSTVRLVEPASTPDAAGRRGSSATGKTLQK